MFIQLAANVFLVLGALSIYGVTIYGNLRDTMILPYSTVVQINFACTTIANLVLIYSLCQICSMQLKFQTTDEGDQMFILDLTQENIA